MTVYPIPQAKVEVAFDPPSVADGSVTWVNVSAYARATTSAVTATRGRSDERASQTDPGTLTLTLSNPDGRFTPGNPTSPYYPDVLPWRRIRVTLTTASTVEVFFGYITSWAVSWQAPAVPVVVVTARDSMALASRRKLRSVLSEEIMLAGPVAYWRLDEPDGATAALDATGALPLRIVPGTGGATLSFGAATGPPCDSASSPQWARVAAGASVPDLETAGRVSASSWTVEAFVLLNQAGRRVELLGVGSFSFGLTEFGQAFARAPSVGGGSVTYAQPLSAVSVGVTHHIAATVDAISGVSVYVDGVLAANSSIVGTLADLSGPVRVGASDDPSSGGAADVFTISHVALYDTELSAVTIEDHYTAGVTGFAGESAFTRISRWCGYVGLGVSSLGGPQEDLAHIDTAGRTALECIGDALATDYGSRIEGDRSGTGLIFTPRSARYNQAATVTMDKVGLDLAVLMDPTYVAATVEVTTSKGAHVHTDPAVLAVYGESTFSLQAFPSDEGFADTLAQFLARRYATPDPRVPTASTDLIRMALNTSLYDAAKVPELGDVVTLTNLPPTAPAASIDLYVEGVTETITASSWTRTVTLSTAAPWTDVGVIEDGTHDRFGWGPGGATVTGGTAVGSTGAGTIVITSTTVAALTRVIAAYPLNLDWNGEVVTISTRPAASTSPQTVTITARGQAGTLARAHASGEPIEVAGVARLAL